MSIEARIKKIESLVVAEQQERVYIIEPADNGLYKVISNGEEEFLNESQVKKLGEDKNNLCIKIEVI